LVSKGIVTVVPDPEAAPLTVETALPEVFAGYRLGRVLGQGGSGRVVAGRSASHSGQVKRVAIKLAPVYPATQRSLLAEYAIVCSLNHAGVVRMHSAGTLNGWEYIVMERIEGMSMAQLLERAGALPLSVCIDILTQLCEVLVDVHGRSGGRGEGVLHLDLKPSNVMVTPSGAVRLIDFGVSAYTDLVHGEQHTSGTPAYMAPEQMNHGSVGPQTDLFALGIILFEMLTGRRFFSGRDVDALLTERRLQQRVELPQSTGFEPVDALITKCTKNSRKERFQSSLELLEVLRSIPVEGPGLAQCLTERFYTGVSR